MNLLLVIAMLGLLLVTLHRLLLSPEASRKGLHLGMGSLCLTFPWLFDSPGEVDLLAALAVGSLLLLRWFKPPLGEVLHRITRLSFGELLFPVGVALVFRLSDGQAALFLPPVAILTYADTAGALVGKRFGRHPYRTKAGQKSVEGSVAVFIVSFLIVAFSGLSDDLLTALLIATLTALVAAMAEGILAAGIDNLVLPIAIFVLLSLLQDLTWPELLSRIALISACGLFLFTVRHLTSLDGGGLLSAAVFGYLCFALGGNRYLFAPLILFVIHLAVTFCHRDLIKMEHSADTISAVALPALIWVVLQATSALPPETAFHAFNLTLMAQVAFLHSATCAHLQRPSCLLLGALKIILVALPLISWWPVIPAALILIATTPLTRSLKRPEQALLAFLFSFLAFLT